MDKCIVSPDSESCSEGMMAQAVHSNHHIAGTNRLWHHYTVVL